jgi:hypothetical protein
MGVGSAGGGGSDAAAAACPLAPRGGAPLLRLSRPSFALLQAAVNQQLAGGGGPGAAGRAGVHGVMAAFGAHLLWSSLAPADTNALWGLAARGPLPAVRAGARHRTVGGCRRGRGWGSISQTAARRWGMRVPFLGGRQWANAWQKITRPRTVQ